MKNEIPRRIGRYEISEEIGRGGMGIVYKAYDPIIRRYVALKVINLVFEDDDTTGIEIEEQFHREATAAGVIHHPNIVTVYDAGEDEGILYLTMEYVKGVTVASLISSGELLPIEKVNSIISQVAIGLSYAHERGIIHRDIKPANIIIDESGTAKVMDFGIAKIVDSDSTLGGVVMGSPNYMNPEQVSGQTVDLRGDIFSLGTVLYQLLTGEKPFAGDNPSTIIYRIVKDDPVAPSKINPSLDPAYDRIVMKALAKKREDRYVSALEIAKDLGRLFSKKGMLDDREGEGSGKWKVQSLISNIYAFLLKPGAIWGVISAFLAALTIGFVIISLQASNPYIKVHEHMKTGRHKEAALALLRIRYYKPKDHHAAYLLGREYAELEDHRSSLLAYSEALALLPEYKEDEKLQDDVIGSLSRPEVDIAIHLIVSMIGEPIVPKLREALKDPGYDIHWNAANAIRRLGVAVDELPLLILDLKYSPLCKTRKAAAERMGELKDPRALPELELAMGDRRNTKACMGNTLDLAKEKINEARSESR
jgi:serine/threonine protein kinase